MLSIRPAELTDADDLGRIHVLAWQSAYAGLMPAEFLAGLSVTDRQADWRERLGDRAVRVLIADDDGAVVGFASFGPSRDADVEPSTGELYAIYLHPDQWRHGIGRRLHADAVDSLRAAGLERLTLWVLDANVRARRFYEAAGWTADGATKEDVIGDSPPLSEMRYTFGPAGE
jgi:GNAT superfamily N-acetyltransferase